MNVFQPINSMRYDSASLEPSILVENYAWVDERLREMYYGYALTELNFDEFDAAGLLKENYAWVDEKLEEMCALKDFIPCPMPLRWSTRDDTNLFPLEDEVTSIVGHKRKRFESDISDHEEEAALAIKRLRYQSPVVTDIAAS